MATKGVKQNGTSRPAAHESVELPDDFPTELGHEFSQLPEQFWKNFGVVTGRVLARGGYIGLSVTDDGGSAKLAVRCPCVSFEHRVYKFTDLERLTAYLVTKTAS